MRSWMAPRGLLFLHIFTHRTGSYRFDHNDPSDWIAQHFFTGGVMPSERLIRQFADSFALEQEWRWSGINYQRTALDWFDSFDASRRDIDVILGQVYGAQARQWRRRWRLFFLTTAGLFGDNAGAEWVLAITGCGRPPMRKIQALHRAVAAYSYSHDPLAAASNFIALCVVGNQPFYPLYVWWIVGDDGWASFVTFLSTPFFLAVPAVARRSSLLGRAMLPIAGIANTVLSAKAFGAASGVELFLCPCAMIAGMALRARERKITLAIIGFAIGVFALLHDRLGVPLHVFSSEEYAPFLSLNAWSVAGLTAFAALQYPAAHARIVDRARR
jgi:hypothetical protein